MYRYILMIIKPFRSIKNWWQSIWYICPKERKGYNCHHRPGECGTDDHK